MWSHEERPCGGNSVIAPWASLLRRAYPFVRRHEHFPGKNSLRALDRRNVTEALSAGAELEHVGLVEALELCLLLRDKAPEKYGRAALRWHRRYCLKRET
jgi:hypothetical protein